MYKEYTNKVMGIEVFKQLMLTKGWDSKTIVSKRLGRNGQILIEIKYENSKDFFYIIQNITIERRHTIVIYEYYVLNEIVSEESFYNSDLEYGDYIDVIMYGKNLILEYPKMLEKQKKQLEKQIEEINLKQNKMNEMKCKLINLGSM